MSKELLGEEGAGMQKLTDWAHVASRKERVLGEVKCPLEQSRRHHKRQGRGEAQGSGGNCTSVPVTERKKTSCRTGTKVRSLESRETPQRRARLSEQRMT